MALQFDKEQNNRLFASIVGHYDFCNHWLSLHIDRHWRRRLVNIPDLAPGSRVLDLCTGTGDVALMLRKRSPDLNIFGMDISHPMLLQAQKKCRRGDHPVPIHLVEGNGLQIPCPDNAFSAVLISFGLRNEKEVNRALIEARRVLHPGGILRILEFAPPGENGLHRLYKFYLGKILPFISGMITGQKAAYKYLAESVQHFLTPEEMIDRLGQCSFKNASAVSLAGGIAYMYEGRK